QHAMDLTAMVGLMIEHMRDQNPARLGDIAANRAGEIGLLGRQPIRLDSIGPGDDVPVEIRALGFQAFPIRVKPNRLRNIASRVRGRGEAAHPDLVAPQQMAKRLVDRAEKGAALALAFLRGEPIGNAIEVFVLPAVVARQALDIGTVDHGALITVMAGLHTGVPASAWLALHRPSTSQWHEEKRGY